MRRATKTSRRRHLSLLAALGVAAFAVRDARAEWPMARHDPQRTAASTGQSALERPTIAWRTYLGGSLGAQQVFAADVDGNGTGDVVILSGGRLVAKRFDDSILWETPPFDLFRIDALRDLNNDGTLDIVATGRPGRVMVFSSRTGALEWRTSAPPYGPSIGAVRFARLDGDMIDDMYIADAACGSTDSAGDVSYAYNFARGFGAGVDNGDQRLWQLERGREYNCGQNDVVADLNNDGRTEVVAFGTRNMYLFEGRTGAKVASGGEDPQGGFPTGFSIPYGTNVTDVVDVDGDGNLDIVGYTNQSYAAAINSRAVFVASYDPRRPAATRLYVRWFRNVANQETDVHTFLQNSAADFDGDGRVEIATTFLEGGVTTTYLFDGPTGEVRARLPDATVRGIYTLAMGQRPTLVVQRGTNLLGYRFTTLNADAAAPAPVFTLPNGTLPQYFRRSEWASGSAANAQLDLAIPGTDRRGLLLVRNNAVELWDATDPPAMRATYALPEDTAVVTATPEEDVAAPGPGVLLARSDGFLLVLDPMLRVINFGDAQEVSLPGIRTGGFYSGSSAIGPVPIAARFDRPASEIVTQNSRGILQRIDASQATITRQPERRWDWRGATNPVAIDENGDGAHDLLVATQGDAIEGRRPDGTTSVFRVPLLSARQSFNGDVVPLRSTSGPTRYAAPIIDRTNGEGTVVAVANNAIAWTSSPIVVAGSGFGYLGVDDADGDGRDDALISMQSPLRLLSGDTGALLASGLPIYVSTPVNVRGRAGAVTVIGSGSVGAPSGAVIQRSPLAINTAWALPTGTRSTRILGAVVQCPTGLMFADVDYGGAHLLIANAETGVVRNNVVLAGGRAFADDAALAATNVNAGLLGNVTATAHLWGDQRAFLVGSTDGYLYAVDPCAAGPGLLWALNLRASVGEAIFADTDGDHEDELLVEASDGFLYGIDTERFPAPMFVNDIDPAMPGTDDVDETRGAGIAASWAAVPGATQYEWAVFTAGGTAISRSPTDPANPFTTVDASTRQVLFGTGLTTNRRYFFAVRAIGPSGTSAEVTSDGTRFTRSVGPLPDASAPADVPPVTDASLDARAGDTGAQPLPQGCGCRVGSSNRGLGALALLAGLALVTRRRRPRA
ncbi:MAG: MYXO-CTERM sorting domain-containing protein [Polyangiales bacterium]